MLNTFSSVAPFIKFNPRRVIYDNLIFKLHYRWTFVLLIVATILVTSRQYIGEHIKCISDSIPANVINTYCFFTPTFTVVRHINNTALEAGIIFEPGIGPEQIEDEPIKRHAYYQWVPFVLFGQALCFYVPHALWKSFEGGRIKALVFGLRMVGLSQYIKGKGLHIGNLKIPCMEETEQRIKDIRQTMINRMRINQSWGAHLAFTEFLNLLNIVAQIYWTNRFLGGKFMSLGIRVLQQRWTDKMDVLDEVFPKVTKCHFRKFGASGSLQMHDTLCVMALNIINEKIYTILWFWFLFLFIMTCLGLIWRLITALCYKNSTFSKCVFHWAKPTRFDQRELASVIEKCNFSNWLFLVYVCSNLSEYLFKRVIYHLSSELPDPVKDNMMNAQFDRQLSMLASTSKSPSAPIDTVDSPLLKAPVELKVE